MRTLVAILLLVTAVGWAQRPGSAEPVFQASDRCIACHNGLTTSAGEDISIGFDWRPGMMANSARDPYWQAGVRREVMDHPAARAAIEHECATCHMPMAHYQAKLEGRQGQVFANVDPAAPEYAMAADGVSCAVCHQISDRNFGRRESFVGHFIIDPSNGGTGRPAYGPFKVDAGRTRIMRSSSGFTPTESAHIRKSELCATCHTLYTKALGPQGQVLGELPEQVPYQEWLHSAYRAEKSCADCHMRPVEEPVAISSVLGVPREGVARHTFAGGNFLMPRILNRFRYELGVAAPPQELEAAVTRTVQHLQSEAARLEVAAFEVRAGRLLAEVLVENLGGHKLPTAYPSRRVWLHVLLRDADGRVLFESGATRPDGSIEGNDNDADAALYEPHHAEITGAAEVQIYESIMGDPAGVPTTGLLSGVKYLKDNRVLPRGFDKRTADKDVAVAGSAAADEDFTGGRDRVRYSVAVGDGRAPFQLEVALRYQPVSFRWAANLRKYDAPEPRRFTRYYDAVAGASAVTLARASASYQNR